MNISKQPFSKDKKNPVGKKIYSKEQIPDDSAAIATPELLKYGHILITSAKTFPGMTNFQ